jgi:hypothetical protein
MEMRSESGEFFSTPVARDRLRGDQNARYQWIQNVPQKRGLIDDPAHDGSLGHTLELRIVDQPVRDICICFSRYTCKYM